MDALTALLLPLVEQGPEPEDVVAGWTAFGLFGLLILAVVVLGFSLTKHLKRAAANESQGAFGSDEPRSADTPADPTQTSREG